MTDSEHACVHMQSICRSTVTHESFENEYYCHMDVLHHFESLTVLHAVCQSISAGSLQVYHCMKVTACFTHLWQLTACCKHCMCSHCRPECYDPSNPESFFLPHNHDPLTGSNYCRHTHLAAYTEHTWQKNTSHTWQKILHTWRSGCSDSFSPTRLSPDRKATQSCRCSARVAALPVGAAPAGNAVNPFHSI